MLHLPLRRPVRRVVSGALAAAAVLLAFPVPSQAGLAIEDGVTADIASGVPGGVSAVVPTGVRAAVRSGVRAGVKASTQASAQASAQASVQGAVQTGVRASIETMIRERWAGTGHASFAVRVAHCESKLDPGARHRNRNGTVDYGVFQLNSGGTLQALGLTARSALDPGTNINAAYRLWQMRGWRPWTCA